MEFIKVLIGKILHHTLSICLDTRCIAFPAFQFFFFLLLAAARVSGGQMATVHEQWPYIFDFSIVCGSYALFTNPQNSFFSNFFIKNGSYGIIYTFKNYFTIVFSVFNF